MRFFAPKRTFKLVIVLNISLIHFTPDFPFNTVRVRGWVPTDSRGFNIASVWGWKPTKPDIT